MDTLEPCDIARHRDGNTGIPYVFSYEGAQAGPHALITALVHGNELCGALALDQLIAAELRPTRGRLSLCFVNIAAYERFDAAHPFASRYVDEDLNRVWSADVLEGPRQNVELERARVLRPLVDSVDCLLDIHSTSMPAPPMLLTGLHKKGRSLARAMGTPEFCVVDAGHTAGTRLRDYAAFGAPHDPRQALLIECGQHLATTSADIALDAALRFLMACRVIDALPSGFERASNAPPQQLIEVTDAVTIETDHFSFEGTPACFERIAVAGSVIAHDGRKPIRSPYDECVLVMPAHQPVRGQTAVRLGRFVAWDDGA